jgi:cytochrome c-type biogenesis protein CcmH/NrfF
VRRALALVLLVLTAAAPAATLAAEPRADFNDVEKALMCDTCNVPLSIAESPRADQERAQIRRLIAQGKTRQQILDAFVAEYGPNVLAEPEGGGGAVAVWLVPAIVLALAAVGIALLLPRWKRRRRTTPVAAEAKPLSSDDAERLERDLALYDL